MVSGVESAVRLHIERGDDLNARDASGMTPLMLCAARNKPDICKLLLSAGADQGLLDPLGRTALQIAIASGSAATASILDAVCAPVPVTPPFGSALDPVHASNHALTAAVDQIDDGEFDLSGWEVDVEPTRPEADLVVQESARAVQIAITAHEPIDSSAEWGDIDAYLPEVALPLAHADDAEGRAGLRLLLLRAIREGSVPALDVQAQSTNEDRSDNPEAEAYLVMVINDLGAEVDERFEYSNADESFEVYVDPDESPSEEAALDEALVAIDRAISPRDEPLRIYQREFQRFRLLTAEEEIRLAKDMEGALDAALDALANWPGGIVRTLSAGAEAVAGTRSLSSVWLGGESDHEPASAAVLEADELAQTQPQEDSEEDDESGGIAPKDVGGAAGFTEALSRLAELIRREDEARPSVHEIRQSLAGLRLSRHFLLELISAANGSASCSAFKNAMSDFLKARDLMTAANLRLAFFHAKKYLHSGEPLDDLAQEGNIGLLKAVNRYDWRRGFRFSTYATWWIRQQISRHIAERGRTIRVPVHAHEKLQRAERTAQAFEMVTGREPTLDELSERLEMPQHKLAALQKIALKPSSIDELTVDGMIAIDSRDAILPPDPADVVEVAKLRAVVVGVLSSLPKKEEQVIRLRFGIGIDDALTLEEVGQCYSVTRERIRQIEARALRKLKHPSRAEPLARLLFGIQPFSDRRDSVLAEVALPFDLGTSKPRAEALEQNDNPSTGADGLSLPSENFRVDR